MMTPNKHMWDNLTIREETPEGTAFIQLVEEEPGKLNKIIFSIGKAGSSLNTYCFALAELCTSLLERGMELEDLSDLLFDITSERTSHFVKGSRSGPEALANSIRKYIQSLPADVSIRTTRLTTKTTKDNYPQRTEA